MMSSLSTLCGADYINPAQPSPRAGLKKLPKKQRSDITLTTNDNFLTLRRQGIPRKPVTQSNAQICLGCGGRPHQGGRSQCPAYNVTCHYCQKVDHYARVCHSKQTNRQPSHAPPNTSMQLPHPALPTNVHQYPSHLSTIKQLSTADPVPTIAIQLSSLNGSCHKDVLPDSGADISGCG